MPGKGVCRLCLGRTCLPYRKADLYQNRLGCFQMVNAIWYPITRYCIGHHADFFAYLVGDITQGVRIKWINSGHDSFFTFLERSYGTVRWKRQQGSSTTGILYWYTKIVEKRHCSPVEIGKVPPS